MSDLADLGLRIRSEEVETANKRLNAFNDNAKKVERATDGLAGGSKRAATATGQMQASVMRAAQAQEALVRAQQTGSRITYEMIQRVGGLANAQDILLGKTTATATATDDLAREQEELAKSTGRSSLAMKVAATAAGLLTSAFLAMKLREVGRDVLAFAASMDEVSTLVDTATFNMKELRTEAIRQAAAFNSQPITQTQALYQIISAGASDSATAVETLNAANKLAVGGVTSVAVAADGLTSVLNAYGNKVEGVTAVSDSMFVAMRAGKTTIGELSSSLGVVAPLAAATGVSFDELTAATAALTKGGITTSTAVQGLRAILAAVAKPSSEATKLSKQLGLEFNSAALASKGFAGFLQELVAKTHGNTDALAQLFGGVEALVPVMALTGQAGKDLAAILEDMAVKAGATDQAFGKIASGPAYQVGRILSALSANAIGFGTAVLDKMNPALTVMANLLSGAQKPSLALEFALKLLATAAGVTATIALGKLATAIYAKVAAAVMGTSAARAYAASIALVGPVSATATVATTALGGAIRFMLGPVGLMITAVGLLAAAWTHSSREGQRQKALLDTAEGSIKAYEQATIAANTATGKAAEKAREHAAELRKEAEAATAAARAMLNAAEQAVALYEARALNDLRQTTNPLGDPQKDFLLVRAREQLARATETYTKLTKGMAAAEQAGADAAADAATTTILSLQEMDKATKRARDQIKDYIEGLKLATAQIGVDPITAKRLEIEAKAAEAAAKGYGDLAAEIRGAGAAMLEKMRAEAASTRLLDDQLAKLALERSLIGATNLERAVALAQLKAEQELRDKGLSPTDAGFAEYVEKAGEAERATYGIQQATAAVEVTLSSATDAANHFADRMTDVADRVGEAARGMADAFGPVGGAIGNLAQVWANYGASVATLSAQQVAAIEEMNRAEKDYGKDSVQFTKARTQAERVEADAADKMAHARRQAYGDMLVAAQGFFEENSAGYKAMQVALIAYRTVEALLAIQSMAMATAETGVKVANAGAQTSAWSVTAFARTLASLPFPYNLAAGATVLAALAAVGAVISGGGGKGASAAPALPTFNTGTGSVLGDPAAQSQSIAKSLEMAEKYHNRDLHFSSQMVSSLRAIEAGIGRVTTAIAHQLGIGGSFDTSGLGLGTTTAKGFLGIGNTVRTAQLAAQGLQFANATLGSILNGGLQGQIFSIIEKSKTKSGFLGIGGGTTTWLHEESKPMDRAIAGEVQAVLGALRGGILTAAGVLGVTGAEAALNSMVVSLGKIDLKGKSASEIAETLNAVFGAVGDQMAARVLPDIKKFQQAGEGAMETLSRLAAQYQVVDDVMAMLGRTFGQTGIASIEARDRLVQLNGGLDEFLDRADFFFTEFLTEAQQIAPIQAAVTKELQRLGIATDITRSQFADLVMGIDVSTASGAQLYAALMTLAPALDKVMDYAEEGGDVLRQRRALEIALMEAQGNIAGALAAKRADELAAMDASLRGLQELVWAEQDRAQRVADARNVLSAAYNRESAALDATANRLRGHADALAQFRQELTMGPAAVSSAEERYRRERQAFNRLAGLAAAGDETAMGQLRGAGTSFLDASKAFATTSQDFLRDRALVLRAVDAASATATMGADTAVLQLDAMRASVTGLLDLNDNVVSVHDAIVALHEAMAGQSPTQAAFAAPATAPPMPVTIAPQSANDDTATREELRSLREDMNAALTAIAANTGKTARKIERFELDGMPVRAVDPTEPVEVRVVA